MATERRTTVCVVGGGPAGMFLGLLLARAGVEVTVLEKHHDFLRDFRGDTVHPTTLDLLDDLGLTEQLAAIEHTEVTTLDAVVKGVRFTAVDFSRVGRSGRLAFVPQWDLLDLLARRGRAEAPFTLLMDTEATGLLRDPDGSGRVVGVRATGPDGELTVHAELTVAADGRDSRLREAAGLPTRDHGVPVDVLWFRLERPAEEPPDTIAYVSGDVAVTIPRDGYHQCALLVPKGSFPAVRAAGIAAFRERYAAVVPFLRPSLAALASWDDVRLLSVQIARAPRWHRPGLLMIGDAAHTMSPAFGVGINDAVQDAVATVHLLAGPLLSGTLTEADLARVQRRRERPAARMQRLQRGFHRVIARPGAAARLPPAAVLRKVLPLASVVTRPLLGRLVGAGFRPERLDRP